MCGIVGILSTTKKDTAVYIYDALTILQHRGQDAAGIVTSHKGRFYMRKANGLVPLHHLMNRQLGSAHDQCPYPQLIWSCDWF